MTFRKSNTNFKKSISLFLSFVFLITFIIPPRDSYAQVVAPSALNIPMPGTMVLLSPPHAPSLMKGVTLNIENPFKFDFYVDTGDSAHSDAEFLEESKKLIKYFLAALSVPNEDLWVNLSPYEKNRIIPKSLGETDLGKNLLAQDYLLKQLSASLLYPEGKIGEVFWEKVYKKAYDLYGTTDIPVDTFNKIWVLPESALVYEKEATAYILESRLKVMMESDYIALKNSIKEKGISSGLSLDSSVSMKDVNDISSAIIQDVIIPEIETEVNAGKNFKDLRQIHASLILAQWFKKKFKESFLGVNYVDQNKINGIDLSDKLVKEKIYKKYLEAFKKGVYDIMREDYNPQENIIIPKRYFSGGITWKDEAIITSKVNQGAHAALEAKIQNNQIVKIDSGIDIGEAGESQEEDLALTAFMTADESLLNISRRYYTQPDDSRVSLPETVVKLETEYRTALELMTNASSETDDFEEIKRNQMAAEIAMMKVVRKWYEIGANAFNKDGKTLDKINLLVAVKAFERVAAMRPLLKAAYLETIGQSQYKPHQEILDDMLTPEKALKNAPPQGDPLYDDYMQYIETMELIKDADQLYIDAVQLYTNESQQNSSLGTIVLENILYNLGIPASLIMRTVNNKEGRSMAQIIELTLSLRELLFSDAEGVTFALKQQAAEFLASVFSQHAFFGAALKDVDTEGGLSVPVEVYDFHINGKGLEDLKKAELITFLTFLADAKQETLHGKSLTAMGWLATFYRKIAKEYLFKSNADAIQLEMQNRLPDLAGRLQEIDAAETLDEQIDIYKKVFPPALREVKEGEISGSETEDYSRFELAAGGIGDSPFLAPTRPSLLTIANAAGALTREDNTVGRPIATKLYIKDRKDLPGAAIGAAEWQGLAEIVGEDNVDKLIADLKENKFITEIEQQVTDKLKKGLDRKLSNNYDKKEGDIFEYLDNLKGAFIRVESLDVGFNVLVTNAKDAISQSKADLILRMLVSKGLLPETMMMQGVKEGRSIETLEVVLEHILGEGRSIDIQTHVKNIFLGSGLAISSLLQMGVAAALDSLFALPEDTIIQQVDRLRIKTEDTGGYYYVEISPNESFEKKDEVYRFPTRSINNLIELDINIEELPTGQGDYYVRIRRVEETPDGYKWFSDDESTEEWINVGTLPLFKKESSLLSTTKKNFHALNEKLSYVSFQQKFYMLDNKETVQKNSVSAQDLISNHLAGLAGSQDQVAGSGEFTLLLSGDPLGGYILDSRTGENRHVKFKGGIVPKMLTVHLSQEARDRINKGFSLLRIGLSDPAEKTLEQVHTSHSLYESRLQADAWRQIALRTAMAAQVGDVEAMGDAAYEGVSLRQHLAPVSVEHAAVLEVLEEFMLKYGKTHKFRYGINGARLTGSVSIFLDPDLDISEINRVKEELAVAMNAKLASLGNREIREEGAYFFKNSKLAHRGTRQKILTESGAKWHEQRVTEPMRRYKKAQREKNRELFAPYSEEKFQQIINENGLDRPEAASPAMKDPNEVVTFPSHLVEFINQRMEERRQQGETGLSPEDIAEIKTKAEEHITEKYRRFNPPNTNFKLREIIAGRIQETYRLLEAANLNSKEERIFFTAVQEGKIDLLWDFSTIDLKIFIKNLTDYNRAVDSKISELRVMHLEFQKELSSAEEEFQNNLKGERKDIDGIHWKTPEFVKDLNEEMVTVEKSLEIARKEIGDLQKQRTQPGFPSAQAERLEILLTEEHRLSMLSIILKSDIGPVLDYGHWVYEASSTYKKHFGDLMEEWVKSSAGKGHLSVVSMTGGMGSRNKPGAVKAVLDWTLANEPDMRYVKQMMRKFGRLLRDLGGTQAFLHLQDSPSVRDALEHILTQLLEEEGLDEMQVAVTSQNMLRIVRPTETESRLRHALEPMTTARAHSEKGRLVEWYISEAKKSLVDAQKKDSEITRPEYTDRGLNPFNSFNPSGNFGWYESIASKKHKIYTPENLEKMGYQLNEAKVNKLRGIDNTIDSEGMTLLKAIGLVEGSDPFVLIIMQGTSLAKIGTSHYAVAKAWQEMKKNKRMVVSQVVNAAANTASSGIFVVDRQTGVRHVLEGSKMTSGERLVFKGDHVAANPGTSFFDGRKAYKLLGYEHADDYLFATDDEITKKMKDSMSHVFPKIYSYKTRKEELPGESYIRPVVIAEVTTMDVIAWIQEQFGVEAVEFLVGNPFHDYNDPKDPTELTSATLRADSRNRIPTKRKLPEGEVEDAQLATDDRIVLIDYYLNQGLVSLAMETVVRAEKSIEDSKKTVSQQSRAALSRLKAKVNSAYSKEENASEDPVYDKTAEEALIVALNAEINNETGNVLNPNELKPKIIEHILRVDKNFDIEAQELLQALSSSLNIHESISRLIAAEILRNITVPKRLKNSLIISSIYNFLPKNTYISQRIVFHIREVIEKLLKNAPDIDDFHNPIRLAFVKNEMDVLYRQFISEEIMDKGVQGMHLSPDKIYIVSDKDATLGEPGERLDFEMVEVLMSMALDAARIDIPTGSTIKESWYHVLKVLGEVMDQHNIPVFMKKLIAQRIRLLAADATKMVQLEVDEDGGYHSIFKNARLFKDGKWVEGKSLLLPADPETGKETNKRNRLIAWESSLRSYLGELFNAQTVWALFDDGSQISEDKYTSFMNFVDNQYFRLKDDDLVDFYSKEAQENFLDMFESLSWVAEKMLNNYFQDAPEDHATQKWAKRLQVVLAPENTSAAKAKFERNDQMEKYSNSEVLFLYLNLLYFKESGGAYVSIDGAPLDVARRNDDRISGPADLVNSREFWSSVKGRLNDYYTKLARSGIFLDAEGKIINFILRNGPGYVNQAFFDFSKGGFIDGKLEDKSTEGKVVVLIGDSKKDLNLPYIFEVKTSSDLKSPMDKIINGLKARSEIELIERLSWDEKKSTFSFRGEMTAAHYQKLKEIQWQLSLSDNTVNEIINEIYEKSKQIFTGRQILRILLGKTFEMDSKQREEALRAGLIETEYSFATADTINPRALQFWGPAVSIEVFGAMHDKLKTHPIIPIVAEDTSNRFASRDRVVRAMIEELNAGGGVYGAEILTPNSMKRLDGQGQKQTDDNSMAVANRGGIDFTTDFGMKVKQDPYGVPVAFRWNGRKVDIKKASPVIYSIATVDEEKFMGIFEIAKKGRRHKQMASSR